MENAARQSRNQNKVLKKMIDSSMEQPRFTLKACYSTAWKAFAKWWFPLCLLAGILMVLELGPKQLAKAESSAMGQTLAQIMAAVEQEDLDQAEILIYELNVTMLAYAEKLTVFMLYAAPFVALVAVLLICTSLMAVKDRRGKYSPGRIIGVSLMHMVLAFAKVLLLFLLLPLGLFIYVKLFFVSLLMLEEGHSPAKAIKGSWRMTNGNFWPLLGMIAINGTLQFAMVPTIIGLVPATGFANTARAAAYSMLRKAGTETASTNSSPRHARATSVPT